MKLLKPSTLHIKKILVALLCSIQITVLAQTTDSARDAINTILAPLNKSEIPTGILAENAYTMLDLPTYNGQLTPDNSLQFSEWRLLYSQILSGAYVAPAGLPNFAQLNTDYTTATSGGTRNVVSIGLIKYASIRPDALTLNLLSTSNGQLYDVANRPGSPYTTKTLFMAAAANATAKNGVYKIYIPSTLYYSNTGLTISSVQVNFDNGIGFVAAAMNSSTTATYTTIGNKKLVYKVTFSNGSIMQCYNNVYVPNIPSSGGTARYAEAAIDPITNADIPDVVINSLTNAHSGADLFIRRSVSNPGSNTNPTFIKPLIVIEGLDVSSATALLGNGYNYNDFREEILNDRTFFNVGGGINRSFIDQLDDVAGYDLIFVNYRNGGGVDDILRNALMLQDVINYVNAHKAAGAQQNVVMGISMGGLVSRYCLAQMVKSGLDPQTRLLLTHDSPHRGANIPLALQHLLQGIRRERVRAFLGIYNQRFDEIFPQLLDVNTLINSPAATQQLLVRVTDDNGTVATNTFLDGPYRTMINFTGTGFTQPYRMVATSQGSQCGVPVMQPYSPLANFDAEGKFQLFGIALWGKANISLDMHALPDLGQSQNILNFKVKIRVKYLIFNYLKISIDIQKTNPSTLLPLDGVAAGTRSLGGALPAGSLNNIATSGSTNWLIFSYNYSVGTPYIAPAFSFVPTTSSLDIDNFSAVNTPYIVPKTGLNGSRMDNYIGQERINLPVTGLTSNTNHTDFYTRTCNWLFNEMENLPDNISCSNTDECLPIFVTYENTSCEGIKEFSLTNVSATTPVAYTVTPTGAAILQPIPPNKVKVLALGNVPYTINAQTTFCNITNTYSSSTYQNAITATQDVTISDISGGTWCGGTSHTFTVNDFGEGATYTWTADPSFTQTFLSTDNKTVTYSYNGSAPAPAPITCSINSYCFQNNSQTILIDYLGNLITKQIKTTSTSFIPLQTNNIVNDNHAYVRFAQPGLSPNNLTYTLTAGFPDVWGSLANDKTQMFVYKRASGGTYTFNAQLVNTTCGTTTNVPFAITLTAGTGFSYEKIFRVVPNPVSSSTTVSINPSVASTAFLNLCINAGAFIRIEIMTNTGFVLQTFNGPPFQQTVNVNMSAFSAGLYFFRISAIGCPSNGVYQEVQQVQKL
jgi:hypothetical protein